MRTRVPPHDLGPRFGRKDAARFMRLSSRDKTQRDPRHLLRPRGVFSVTCLVHGAADGPFLWRPSFRSASSHINCEETEMSWPRARPEETCEREGTPPSVGGAFPSAQPVLSVEPVCDRCRGVPCVCEVALRSGLPAPAQVKRSGLRRSESTAPHGSMRGRADGWLGSQPLSGHMFALHCARALKSCERF